MAINIVQHKPFYLWVDFNTVWNVAFDNPTVTGNAIIAHFAGNSIATIACGDDKGNSYHTDLTYFPNPLRYGVFSVPNGHAAQTITITFDTSAHIQGELLEISGLQTSGIISDQTNNAATSYILSPSSAPFTSNATPTTSQASEFLLGATINAYPPNETWTDDSPWNLIDLVSPNGTRYAYQIVSSTGTYAYTGTYSNTGDSQVYTSIVTYKAAADVVLSNPVMGFESDFAWGGGETY